MGKNMKTSSATKMAPTALKGFDLFDLLLQINGKQHCNIARIQHICEKSKTNNNCYQSYIRNVFQSKRSKVHINGDGEL